MNLLTFLLGDLLQIPEIGPTPTPRTPLTELFELLRTEYDRQIGIKETKKVQSRFHGEDQVKFLLMFRCSLVDILCQECFETGISELITQAKDGDLDSFCRDTAKSNASKLLAIANVRAYLDARTGELAQTLRVQQEMVLRELKRVGFSNIQDYVTFGEHGVKLKNSADLTREQLAAISQVSETVTQHAGSKTIKLHD